MDIDVRDHYCLFLILIAVVVSFLGVSWITSYVINTFPDIVFVMAEEVYYCRGEYRGTC